MSITREDIAWSIKYALIEEAAMVPKNSRHEVLEFIKNEATYEQLLNLYYNRNTDVYTEAAILEGLFLEEADGEPKAQSKSTALVKVDKSSGAAGAKPGMFRRAANKAGEWAGSVKKHAWTNRGKWGKAGVVAGGIGVGAAAGALVYRMMKKKGEKSSDAAEAAAARATNPSDKAKWKAKAQAYKAQGK